MQEAGTDEIGVILNENAPVGSIPPEILSAIFETGHRMAIFSDSYNSDDSEQEELGSSRFEVVVSHVTTYFRAVAIDNPALWSRIDVSPQLSKDELAVYLDRSKRYPLDLHLYLKDVDDMVSNEMVDILFSQMDRWLRFSVESDFERDDNPVLARLVDSSAPLLEHLSISVADRDPTNISTIVNSYPQTLRGGAPRLSFVRLGGLSLYFFRPPLANVTTLHIDQTKDISMRYTEFRAILTAPRALVNLSVMGDILHSTDSWVSPNGELINLPALRALRIGGNAGKVYCGILLGIRAPSLESLVLKDVLDQDLDPIWRVYAERALHTPLPRLLSLTFCDFELCESTYHNLSRVFPEITQFTSLYSSVVTPLILKLLRGGGNDSSSSLLGPPWPHLHTLRIIYNPDDEELVADVVRKREEMGYPITNLSFGTSSSLSTVKNLKWFEEHVKVVERFDDASPWPEGLHYVDRDDFLFF